MPKLGYSDSDKQPDEPPDLVELKTVEALLHEILDALAVLIEKVERIEPKP